MKFEYEDNGHKRECVAYMENGALIYKDEYGDCVFIDADGFCGPYSWDPDEATHKFYPGDKITITF